MNPFEGDYKVDGQMSFSFVGGVVMNTEVMFSSKTDNWATPQDFYNKLDKRFNFELDPCADEENHKCPLYYTKEEDGLKQDWGQYRTYVNPPYGREISKWVEKAYKTNKEHGNLIVMLLPARTDTRWFHNFIYKKAEIEFIKGRLKFGNSKDSAPFPSMIVIFEEGKKSEKSEETNDSAR